MFLVTGATGFVGKHLVDRLLARGEAVRCLVRATSLARFEALVAGRWNRGPERTPTAVTGDLSEPMCGLDPADLAGVTHLFHVAALYDLKAHADACEAANVAGTEHVLQLCEALGATLHHVSTIAVAGSFEGTFTEEMLDEGQSHGHPYPQSKFEAEQLVRSSAVPHRIYRPGAVVGSTVDGAADKADGLYMLFPLIRRLRGALPAWVPMIGFEGAPFPLAPVDWVATALDHLAHTPGLDGRTFHLVDPDPPTFGAIGNALARAAHAPRFAVRLDASAFDLLPGASMLLGGLAPVRRLRKRALGGGDGKAMLGLLTGKTRIDSAATQAALGGAVPCPPFDSYAAKLWDHWDRQLRPATARTLRDRVDGKVVVITGASSGIGREVALRVAADGAIAILVARSEDKLQELAIEIRSAGGTAEVHPCDVSDYDAIDELVARLLEAHGAVDILVNNAGRSIRRSIHRVDGRFHDFERTIALNYLGALRLTLGLLPAMREQGDGHIVNVLTMGLQTRVPRFAAYLGSKAALEAACGSIGAEVLHDGVRFTSVMMPLVRTPMIAPTEVYKGFPSLSPEEGAALVADGIVRRPTRVSTGLGTMAAVWGIVAPGLGLQVLNRGARMVPDEEGDTSSEQPGGGRVGRILKAFHW